MIGVRVNQAKSLFFDRRPVQSAVSKAERRTLSRFGAFVRSDARRSIRRAPKKNKRRGAAPGKPPYSRTGLIKSLLFFVFDPSHSSVVIGPAKINRPSRNALETLEHGGRTTILTRGRRGVKERKQVAIEARPFMQPAFDKNLPKVPGMWRDAVSK